MADRNGVRPEMVALGSVVNTHGIRGEVRMLPFNPDTDAFHPGMSIALRRGATSVEYRLAALRRHKRFLLLTLDGVGSMSEAEKLVGAEVEVPVESLPKLPEGAAYHFQLVGLEVVTTAGESLGRVEEVFTTAANDVVVVRRDGRELLIPYVGEVVRAVDLEAKRLVIAPLPGLIDE